jgi:hypothetical protein
MKHPNAAAAGGTTTVSVLVVWLAGYLGLNLSAELGAVIAGGATTLILLFGRVGLRGILGLIWHGGGKSPRETALPH